MHYRLNILIFLSIALVLLFLGMAYVKSLPKANFKEPSLQTPDAWMESVDAIILNQEGRLLMKIHTPKLHHFNKNDMTLFEMPSISLYRPTSEPWTIRAKSAKATKGMRQIDLTSDVTLHHASDTIHPATWMTTESLTVKPHSKEIETMRPITFAQPHWTIQGVGMKANLNSGDVILLSEMRGSYALQTSKP